MPLTARILSVLVAALSLAPTLVSGLSAANSSSTSFGSAYAVLQLDYVNFIVNGLRNTTAGDAFLNTTATWTAAVHSAQTPGTSETYPNPLLIFSRIAFRNSGPPYIGLDPLSPFGKNVIGSNNVTFANEMATGLAPEVGFVEGSSDIEVIKTRYTATAYNDLLAILQAARIDTVVLSGVRSSGVILSTSYALFDAGFKVYVLKDVTYDAIEATQQAIMAEDGILAKLPAQVLTLAEALTML